MHARLLGMGNSITRQVLPGASPTVSPESLRGKGWRYVALRTTFLAVSPENDRNLYVVFCHGNSEDVGSALSYHDCAGEPLGACTIGFEYAGYGMLRAKNASESTLVKNVEEACAYADSVSSRAGKHLVMSGRSLGCALAVTGAILLGKRCTAVILQSPFVNTLRVRLPRIVSAFLTEAGWNMFENDKKIRRVIESTALIVFHGSKDRVVPPSHSSELYGMASHLREREIHFLDAGHNNICVANGSRRDLQRFLAAFFERILHPKAPLSGRKS